MLRRHTLILTLFIALATSPATKADTKCSQDTAVIYFHQSYADFLPDYRSNAGSIDTLLAHLDSLGAENASTRLKISRVNIVGAASPEGTVPFNDALSLRRADTLGAHLATRLPVAPEAVETWGIGRDWTGLLALAEADGNVPYRDEVVAMLAEIASHPAASDLGRLKSLRGGTPYRYLYEHLFPQLRASSVAIDYYVYNRLPGAEVSTPDLSASAELKPVLMPHASGKAKKPFYMALKTNMIYDALAIPSVGAEIYAGKDISIVANWMYGWWDSNPHHHYWRYYGGDVAVRWWFGRAAAQKPLTGHHIGVYGGVFTFDFEMGGTGYMGGKPGATLWDRCMTTAGIEYGYSLPVGRRINIDFTIGFGYIGGKYIKYEPFGNGYRWLSTHRLRWFGPAKAEISLTWLIGRGNYNTQKGGRL